MTQPQPNNPLHGITLEQLLNELVAFYGWPALGREIDIRCFNHEPSISSSLRFLRRTPWAREQVEALYLHMLKRRSRRLCRQCVALMAMKVPSKPAAWATSALIISVPFLALPFQDSGSVELVIPAKAGIQFQKCAPRIGSLLRLCPCLVIQ
jgi:uncharacterized protein (DUF2132 family)